MTEVTYTKLSNLVDDSFTVEKSYGYQFKKWDPESGRMLVSETYQEGFRKVYTLETDKGKLDVGSGQLSALLEAVYYKGSSDLIGRSFNVKSNGKTGMDIRYYFNPIKQDRPPQEETNFDKFTKKKEELKNKDVVLEDIEDKPIDLDGIPF